jgi:hypothetical protein
LTHKKKKEKHKEKIKEEKHKCTEGFASVKHSKEDVKSSSKENPQVRRGREEYHRPR